MTTRYIVEETLRRNIAELEKELQRQKERAGKRLLKLVETRDDNNRMMEQILELKESIEKAEEELKAAREQEPVGYVFSDWRGATTVSATKDNHFIMPLYARPIPAPCCNPPEVGND